MSVFDLLFLVIFLGSVVALVAVLVSLLRGRRSTAVRILRALGTGLGIYFLIVIAVDIAAPQRVLGMGEDRCFDEMCLAATGVRTAPEIGPKGHMAKARGVFYLVTVRVHSRALRRAQREAGVNVSLIDSQGHTYNVSPAGERAYEAEHGPVTPLVSQLAPGQTIESVQVFDVPAGAKGVALHIGHDGPGLLIIGDDESPWHRPTIIPLKS